MFALDSLLSESFFVIIVMFAFQIYCDFSGYTDIARGTAMLFGIELMDNFVNENGVETSDEKVFTGSEDEVNAQIELLKADNSKNKISEVVTEEVVKKNS